MSGRVKSMEHRATTRIPIRVLVEYQRMDDFLADYSANISLGGMFIATDKPLDTGTRFRLRFRVPGRARPVETYGEVRWAIQPGTGMAPGMGIAFDELAPGERRAVEALLVEWEREQETGR